MVRKLNGTDEGKLYAMKVLKKAAIVQKTKTTEHTKTERQVLEAIRESPFLVTLHYAFQTDAKLHLILGEYFLTLLAPKKQTAKFMSEKFKKSCPSYNCLNSFSAKEADSKIYACKIKKKILS